jgi:hypothetical protein
VSEDWTTLLAIWVLPAVKAKCFAFFTIMIGLLADEADEQAIGA